MFELKNIIKECLTELDENTVVTFGQNTYPEFGWFVFMGGGSGSGKGYALDYNVPINGKVINVDHWKHLYAKMSGVKYDSHDPNDVANLHKLVKNREYKKKYIQNILNPKVHTTDRLPNIILDITAKDPEIDVAVLAKEARSLGYKTALIWIVSTRHEAIIRNIQRDRMVPDRIFHKIHNELMKNMPPFINSQLAKDCLDDIWLIFSSAPNIDQSNLPDSEKKTAVVKLQKGENGFIIDEPTMKRLVHYLGQVEKNPESPETYLSSKEIIDKYGTPNDRGGYTIDREKVDLKNKFYR